MICGDLDSIRPEVMQYYQSRGIRIIKDVDQYSTDLMKCLKYVGKSEELIIAWNVCFESLGPPPSQRIDVALFGGLGGRADQALSQLHHLYVVANQRPSLWNGDLHLITTEAMVFLLEKGLNEVYTPIGSRTFTENVGIIPIGRPSVITTHGLEWDVKDWPTEFGTQISTSNHIKEEIFQVDCSERVLLTLEFDRGLHQS